MFPAKGITKTMKTGAMALKAVVPRVLGNLEEWELLEEDLCRIDCHGFFEKPWNLKM